MKKIIISSLLFILINSLFSTIIEIFEDGSGDYISIQTGIDSAANNDTILVNPGSYYENIYIDKSISLISQYELTNNSEYIDSTFLDGNNMASVVFIEGNESDTLDIYLSGFTIMNGAGTEYSYGTLGGGIYSRYTSLIVTHCKVNNNHAKYGGGISCTHYSNTKLINTNVCNNYAESTGGGIAIASYSTIEFDATNRCNIYLNFAGRGNDVYRAHNCSPIHVVADTFTVIEPSFYYIYFNGNDNYYEPEAITYDIQNAYFEQAENDLYVATDGSNDNSGLTPSEPLKSINYALAKIKADSLHPRTIYIADGLYSPSLNNQAFALHMKSFVSLEGESRENTILDAEGGTNLIIGHDYAENEILQRNYQVANLSLINVYDERFFHLLSNKNITFSNLEISSPENYFNQGMQTWGTNINLHDIYIRNNEDCNGNFLFLRNGVPYINITNLISANNNPGSNNSASGGMRIENYESIPSVVNIYNSLIANNENHTNDWEHGGSAMYISEDTVVNLINSTICGNYGLLTEAISLAISSELNIYNSIIYGNNYGQIYLGSIYGNNYLSVNNSCIEDGLDGIVAGVNNTVDWGEGNINEDPLFDSLGTYPFALTELSTCIDAGTTELPAGIELPETDLAGNPRMVGETIDMGCYEYQGSGNNEEEVPTPKKSLLSAYPNPFYLNKGMRSTAKIKLKLARSGNVRLELYNLKGEKVKTLMAAYLSTGSYKVRWDGRDNHGKFVASGTYFCKFAQEGRIRQVRKITVVK